MHSDRQGCKALAQVQQDLQARKLGLKVWDCYRPAKAVESFVAWAGSGTVSTRPITLAYRATG